MKATAWKRLIMKQCKEVGTMRDAFKPVIDTLSDILEQRDAAYSQFLKEGSNIIVERVSDRGAVNPVKNPLWLSWQDLNSQALKYWDSLGLTPKGLKAISEDAMKKEQSAFGAALDKILGGG